MVQIKKKSRNKWEYNIDNIVHLYQLKEEPYVNLAKYASILNPAA